MKHFLLVGLVVTLLLSACTDTTVVDIRVSALALIPAEQRSRTVPIIAGLSDVVNFPLSTRQKIDTKEQISAVRERIA